MSAEVRDRAFEPFFTTKPKGEGSRRRRLSPSSPTLFRGPFSFKVSAGTRGKWLCWWLKILSDIYHATYREVRYLGLSGSAGEKLARFLLDLAADSSKTSAGGHADRVALTLTHDEIAQMLGSSRETVTRLFADFRRKHLIEVHGSTLVITNKVGLEKKAVASIRLSDDFSVHARPRDPPERAIAPGTLVLALWRQISKIRPGSGRPHPKIAVDTEALRLPAANQNQVFS